MAIASQPPRRRSTRLFERIAGAIRKVTTERDEMKRIVLLSLTVAALSMLTPAGIRQDRDKLDKIEQALKDDVPRILCVDERIATGGQPTDSAFAKLAANGYRSVLNLRTGSEGVDLKHEQEAIEKAGLRYINIPVVSSAP